jgi:DNA modification methylase
MKLSDIKPNPKNPRTIRDENFKKLVQSIKDFPEMLDARPLVLNKDNVILGGNMRYKAAIEAGLTELPVKIVDWPEDKQREFIIKDNVSGGEWDWDILANEWDTDLLDDWGLELPDSIKEETEVEEDEAPEVSSEPPASKPGEIYQLGRHRVMCGDSTKREDVDTLMDGNKADMVFTDPPYGNGISGKYGRGQPGVRTIEGDTDFSVTEKALANLSELPQLFFLQWRTFSEAYAYLASVGKSIKTIAVWDKKNAGLNGAGGMAEQWEAIIISGDCKYKRFGGNVFSISREQKNRVDSPHPHQKPIKLLAELFDYFEATTLLDPFLGSGSTLIACEQTDRTCYGMELDPKYTDVIRKRYAKFIDPNGWEESWQTMTPAIN